jgi:LysR family transcriptional regulator (chromosome initiation inhibitor)
MNLGAGQLSALAAVCREGSFERAAAVLHVTPSAISQRIKQLEEQVGAILVVRASPCVPTPIGEAVYRHALQVELLERDVLRAVDPDADVLGQAPMRLSIAVNADSLATWLVPALQSVASRHHLVVDVTVDDQDHTTQWLRSGRVMGAVTSQGRPVQGCRLRPLGIMRYVATATGKFVRRWFPDGFERDAAERVPCVAYNRKDRMCGQFVAQHFGGDAPELSAHSLPSPHAYLEACLCGLGWGMNPRMLVDSLLRRRRLVDLCPGHGIDVPLYWQQWAVATGSVDALGDALVEHAADVLLPIA